MIKRIPVDKIKIGMYISEHTKGLADMGIKNQGFIKKESTIKKLLSHQLTDIFIDTSKGVDSDFGLPIFENNQLLVPKVPLETEKKQAAHIYKQASSIAQNLINNVRKDNKVEVAPIHELAQTMSESVLRNPNALLCLSQIKHKDDYLLEHSINVGVLLGVFATYLGYPKETVNHLITGGILHDIGKIHIPDAILNKPSKLTADEWVIMKEHVPLGVKTLQAAENIHPITLDICGLHHEKIDGTGYPNGVSSNQLSQYTKMASIADIYDALTATRVYKASRDPFTAIKMLHAMAGNHLDRDLVYSFIRCFSVYPIGTSVKLNNETIGIVISTSISSPDRPTVKQIYCLRSNKAITPKICDLSHTYCEVNILGVVDPEQYRIDVMKYL